MNSLDSANPMPLDLWLNDLAALAGYDSGDALVADTGADCWMESYNDGLTPAEAWQEDCANG